MLNIKTIAEEISKARKEITKDLIIQLNLYYSDLSSTATFTFGCIEKDKKYQIACKVATFIDPPSVIYHDYPYSMQYKNADYALADFISAIISSRTQRYLCKINLIIGYDKNNSVIPVAYLSEDKLFYKGGI